MMARIASDALIERLADWGVDTVFGLPGDGINGIMEALRRNQDKVRFVLVHHEEAAAFMATLMAEFITAIQHKLPVKVVISNNSALGQILWEQMILGYPEHGVRYPGPNVDYAAIATANGAYGVKVRQPGDLSGAVRQALSLDGPALVDVDVNPDEPRCRARSSTSRRRSSPRRS